MPLSPSAALEFTPSPGTEVPTVPGYYVVYERLYLRPLALFWHSAERGWRYQGSRVNAAWWFGPLPEINPRNSAPAKSPRTP